MVSVPAPLPFEYVAISETIPPLDVRLSTSTAALPSPSTSAISKVRLDPAGMVASNDRSPFPVTRRYETFTRTGEPPGFCTRVHVSTAPFRPTTPPGRKKLSCGADTPIESWQAFPVP